MPKHLDQPPDGAEQSAADRPYEVGRGKPPVDGTFKPGHPPLGGRPKGQRNVATVLRKGLNERTKIREGHRIRSVTKLDAVILKMINDAALGNPKAQANLIALMRAVGLVKPSDEPTRQALETEPRLSSYILSEEILNRLSDEVLDELIRIAQEVKTEQKNKLH
jgi:hypothetical protein